MLHLLSHVDGRGGLSTLVDGFKVADVLRHQSELDFETLINTTVCGHASGNSDIGSIMPVSRTEAVINLVELGQHSSQEKSTYYNRIRWNNSDRVAWSANKTSDEIQRWYAAAKVFNSLVNDPRFLWQFQLQPGRPLSMLLWMCQGLKTKSHSLW